MPKADISSGAGGKNVELSLQMSLYLYTLSIDPDTEILLA